MKSLPLILALIVVVFTMTLLHASSKGIITIEGYGEAVALCGEESSPQYYADDNMTMIQDKYATIVINHGHKGDPQVKDLRAKAERLCKQYYR